MARRHRGRLLREVPALVGLLALLASGAKAQVIRGVVVEAADSASRRAEPDPIPGAEVELLMQGQRVAPRVLTDSLGLFLISVPQPGTYGIRVSHPAYLTYESGAVEVASGESVALEVRLGHNVIPLEPLVVTARVHGATTGFNQRRGTGAFGTFLTREDIQTRAAARTSDLLRGLPGVTIRFQRWGVAPAIEMRNGFGICEPAIFVDGVRAPVLAGGGGLDDFLTPDRIEAVEVYNSFSMAPVQYISGHCGVILFWTRSGDRAGGKPWHWKRMILGLGAAVVAIVLWIR